MYDNILLKTRGNYVAFYNFLLGLAIITGGLIGSSIISFIPIHFMNKYHFLFLISGIVRVLVVIGLITKIKEVRVSTKPILNIKNLSIYKWLYDITLRNNQHKKQKHTQKS